MWGERQRRRCQSDAVPPAIGDAAALVPLRVPICGTQSFGGLDRGRALSAMDKELVALLEPCNTPKVNYAVQPPAALLSQVFWDEPTFSQTAVQRDRLCRSAKVMVYSCVEQGE